MLPLSLRVSAYGLCAVAGHGKVVLSGATFFMGPYCPHRIFGFRVNTLCRFRIAAYGRLISWQVRDNHV